MTAGPLAGITVLDVTRLLAGPYCTMLLADLGARVIKVERPDGGDGARGIGPFIAGKSAYFMTLNRGKESIALDLGKEQDRAVFEKLLARADVLVENFRVGTMEKLGYDFAQLQSRFPHLIYAAISGFGHTGPYRHRLAYDMVVQAMGGIMSLTGHAGAPPTRVGTSIGDIVAGIFTAVGIGTALYQRTKTGRGMKIDIGMLDCQVAILENAIARYVTTGEVPRPLGSRHPSAAPFEAYATADGWIVIAIVSEELFARLAKALGRPGLAGDPRFRDNNARCANVDALHAEITRLLKPNTTEHWLGVFEKAGVPAGPINNIAQVLDDIQVRARNMVVTVLDPVTGPVKMPGNPVKFSDQPDPPQRQGAPALDADRQQILAWLDRQA
jgi:CoA:oxalate CoA-transferase